MRKIKIAHQQRANKPIYLLRTGAIECGNFRYDGDTRSGLSLLERSQRMNSRESDDDSFEHYCLDCKAIVLESRGTTITVRVEAANMIELRGSVDEIEAAKNERYLMVREIVKSSNLAGARQLT